MNKDYHKNIDTKEKEIKNSIPLDTGTNQISSIISQILKVAAAIDSGKITQEEGYEILRGAGIGEKELTELINMIESLRLNPTFFRDFC